MLQWVEQHLQPQQTFTCRSIHLQHLQPQQTFTCTAISTILHPPKDWEQLLDDGDSTLTRAYLEKCLRRTNIFYQNNKFSVEEERNGKLALLDILLK